MRDWSLGPGDPLSLTLAADFRLSVPDYANDHIWELEFGSGDPPALGLRTTYGLRARSMRIFPSFRIGTQTVTDPAAFSVTPRLRRFYPNFLLFDLSPLPDLDVVAEIWVPGSQVVAGRFALTNRTGRPLVVSLDLCALLVPLDDQGLASLSMRSVNVLARRSEDLAPVIFLTGGPQPGPGPYPSLTLTVELPEGGARQFTWAQAALGDLEASFELARRTAARPWDAERAKIELVNAAQTVEVYTGDPDWDAALAFSQVAAFRLFFGSSTTLPYSSFVQARQPDSGYSPHGDGSDYPHGWNGQPALESYYLASLLPGAPQLAEGLMRNFLAAQAGDGSIDWKPGLAGQRGRWLASPLLFSLAWNAYEASSDLPFLKECFPGLLAFYHQWFTPAHDRDADGFPEWDHPLQTGFEDAPAFNVWPPDGQGADITAVESPALASALYRGGLLLGRMASLIGREEERAKLELQAAALHDLAEECWNPEAVLYHYRDRDSHHSPKGKVLAKQRGPGKLELHQSFKQPVRMLVKIFPSGESRVSPEIILKGHQGKTARVERLDRINFQWGAGVGVATTGGLFTDLTSLSVAGLEKRDQVIVQIMDFTYEDLTLFLPFWAGIPDATRAGDLVKRTLFAADRFGRPFGIPACANAPDPKQAARNPAAPDFVGLAVHLPWNQLIGEGLLAYGLHAEAAQLTTRLMGAVIENLKKQRAFSQAYHAETGAGIGERNALEGLAPLGLFLKSLGVEIRSPSQVVLSGKNPFPWPVTVKYRGLIVTRQAARTVVVFPDEQTLTLDDPTEAMVSLDT